jgi:hypothetical protein
MTTLDPAAGQSFLNRAVRVVGWVCLLHSILLILNLLLNFASGLTWTTLTYAYRSIFPLYVVVYVFELLGSILLLRWKSAGRTLLLIWPWLSIAAMVFSNVVFLRDYLPRMSSATSQPSPNPMLLMARTLLNALTYFILPLLIFALLRHREVRDLWAKGPSGGFEVVPLAQKA